MIDFTSKDVADDVAARAIIAEIAAVKPKRVKDGPTPLHHNPFLASAGYHLPKATRHYYECTRLRGDVYEFVYRCSVTKVTRVWGSCDAAAWRAMQKGPMS